MILITLRKWEPKNKDGGAIATSVATTVFQDTGMWRVRFWTLDFRWPESKASAQTTLVGPVQCPVVLCISAASPTGYALCIPTTTSRRGI